MPTVLDFINNQFKKAGVEMPAEMKETLNNPELTKVNLPDQPVKDVNERLMTIDIAKQSPILKQHFRQETLLPLDTEIHEKLLAEYEIPDDLAAAIKSEKSTYEKVNLLTKAIKQLQEKKINATTGDKKHLTDKIDELNAAIVSLRATTKAEKDQLINESKQKELTWNMRGAFAGYNYSDQYDKSDAMELAMINLNRQLNADNAKVILTPDGHLRLVQATDESLDFTRENQKVSFKDYADKLVADKKLIKTTDTTKPPAATVTTTAPTLPGYVAPVKAMSDLKQALIDAGVENGQVK